MQEEKTLEVTAIASGWVWEPTQEVSSKVEATVSESQEVGKGEARELDNSYTGH